MADIIARLKLESSEFDSKVKRASQGLMQMEQECRRVGGTLAVLDKEQMEFVQNLGKMETVSKTAKGSLAELTAAYTDLSMQYRRLSEEEKKGDFGRALSSSLGEMKQRILDAKKGLADINREISGSKFGQFGNVIDTIGQKMGMTGNITELLASRTAMMTGAIGAGIAIIGKATQAWASYNSELSRQTQITSVTTGLQGADANQMTDSARAMTDTYGVDFKEAIKAANTLMAQFGETGQNATKLIRDGLRGMILGDGPKLLSMIQQYAPAFHDAGVSASQLVAVIQNSEGGIFTDQNMNAIVMGIKNIRLMTDATANALAKLGIDGRKMSEDLTNGTLTVFDALRQVAAALKNTEAGGRTAGEVMQQVFGRQGVTAGTNIAKAIETLNTNLEETKRQTGELGDAYDDLYEANEKLNNSIREAFSYDGWEQMATGIKSKLVSVLADVIEKLGQIRKFMNQQNQPSSNTKLNVDRDINYLDEISTREKRYDVYVRQLQKYNDKLAEIDRQREKVMADVGKNGWMAQHMSPTGQMISNQQRYNELEANRARVVAATEDYRRRGYEHVNNPVRRNTNTTDTTSTITNQTTTTTRTETPQQRAERTVSDALQKYNDAVALATKQMEKGNISDAEYQRQMQSQQQRLYDAYGQAYRIHTDPKYKDAQQKAADEIVRLGGAVKQATEEQQAVQQAARQLEQAQKKLAEAQAEQAKARQTGDLKAIYTADKKVAAAEEQVQKAQLVTVKVDNPDVLRQIEALKGIKTVKVNVEQGKVDMPDVPTDDKTIRVNVEQGKVDMPDVSTDDKTIRVNVEQGKVDMPDVPTESKPLVVSVEVDDAEAIRKLQAMKGVTVTADIVPGTVQLPDIPKEATVPVKFTSDNLEAFKSNIKEKLNGAEVGSQLYKDLTAQLADATAIGNLMNTAIKNGIDFMQFHPAELWSKIFGKNPGDYITDDELQSIIDKLNEGINGKGGKGKGKGIKLNFNTGEIDKGGDDKKGSEKSAVDVLSQMNSGMNNVVSSLTQLGVEIPTGFKEMLGAVGSVFGVLQGIATIVLSIKAMQEVGTFLGIFAQGGIVPHMADGGIVPTTHAIPALPHFADGGIIPHAADGYYVPGNRFSGDTTPILANAGELVLNRAAQGNLASQLDGTNLQNLHLDTEITAESIRFVLNNRGRRTGKGEYVQSRFYRH